MKVRLIIVLGAILLLLAGCADKSAEKKGGGSLQPQEKSQLSFVERKEQAYDIFKQILELSDSQDRKKNVPQIKKLYREIIDTYPDIGLAQESYLRLIIIAREEKTTAGDAEAEKLYQEFLGKYPDSNLKRILETEARRAY